MVTLTKFDLVQFTGTTQYYKHWLGYNYTDGVQYLAEKGQCYWLLDAIFSYQDDQSHVPFQLWKLDVNPDRSAILTMREDSDLPALVTQNIPYTDFSLDSIKLYLIDGVLILPSEY